MQKVWWWYDGYDDGGKGYCDGDGDAENKGRFIVMVMVVVMVIWHDQLSHGRED